LRDLILYPERRADLGGRGRDSVTRFDAARIVAEYEALFDQLLAVT